MAGTVAHFPPANASELERSLRKIWRHGANVIVGWYAGAHGLKILHLPSYALSRASALCPDILAPDKSVTEAGLHRLTDIGARVANVRLSFDVPRDEKVIAALNRFIRKFSITRCECRCVSLFDIVNFSAYEPFDQITLITMLSHHIDVAAEQCNRLGLAVDICMTTTGDGFYVWNGRQGLGPDIALYTVTMLALIYNYAALNVAEKAAVPTLRCCVNFGGHFEYTQQRGGGGDGQSFIVGDVTVELARMMSVARPDQILIGSHSRAVETGRRVDTPGFMTLAQAGLDKLPGLQVPGGKIAAIRSYLTGARDTGDRFTVKQYSVIDKHDISHACFNAKLNFTDGDGNDVYIGCMDQDLEGFAVTAPPIPAATR